ncbi:odorant receptor 22c-like isoform X1 [Solenopsis invicta]|uniref:odorant receptor 22c-like isoform X1 n=1 Tax=Solenopsis invicta TaxID=13686 RepID=UPI00193DD248|nr:odorant receptor 22c-like isoform X1 [Solenopsis invicta]
MDTKESLGYKDFEWAIEIHRLGLEFLGLWPKNEVAIKSLWSKLHASIILILIIFVSNVPMISAAMQSWDNMVTVIDILRITLPVVTASIKYIIMRWKQTVLLSIINMMAEDWIAFKLDAERVVMIKQARVARLSMVVGYVIIIIACLTITVPTYFGIQVLNLMNVTGRCKLLPLQTYHFYNVDKSPQFELTFFFHVLTIFVAGSVYMIVDIFLLLLVLHICGQLENFRYRLVSLVSCEDFNKALNNIVTSHLRLIRFINKIENIYYLMMLLMVLYLAIIICLNSFLFTILLHERKVNGAVVAQIFYLMIFLLVTLTGTFLYCCAGELIMEQCNALYRALCELEWYKLESRKARNLILLMTRAHNPCCITAGKIIPLTLTTFCSILKTSSGYMSFLVTQHG